MYWKKCIPEAGQIKNEVKFAFFPTRLNKCDIIWLERYLLTKKCCKNNFFNLVDWIDIDKKRIVSPWGSPIVTIPNHKNMRIFY